MLGLASALAKRLLATHSLHDFRLLPRIQTSDCARHLCLGYPYWWCHRNARRWLDWRIFWLAQRVLIVGLPGIFLSVIVFFTIREPKRGLQAVTVKVEPTAERFSLMETIRFMWSLKAFRHLSFAGALHAFVGYGVALFLPSFFMRIHGYGLAETSTYLFLIGLTGIIGTYFGGFLGDRYGQTDQRWYMYIPGVATLISVPFAALFTPPATPCLPCSWRFLERFLVPCIWGQPLV